MAKDRVQDWDTTAANNTDVGGVNIAEGMSPAGVNNAMREMMSQTREAVAYKAADIASASSIDLTDAGSYVDVTGTTTITALGTTTAGTIRRVQFDGALTLTHNATSLILPGGANITTAAGDTATFISEGSGNWRCIRYQRGTGQPFVQVATAGLADNAVTTAGLADNAVTTAKITDANVTLAKLAAAASPAEIYLGTATVSAATELDLESLISGTYSNYVIVLENISPGTSAADLWMRVSDDNGATYETANYNHVRVGGGVGDSSPSIAGASADTKIVLGGSWNTAANGHVVIDLSVQSGRTRAAWRASYATSTPVEFFISGSGQYSAAGVNAVRFLFSTGTITGKATIYGRR